MLRKDLAMDPNPNTSVTQPIVVEKLTFAQRLQQDLQTLWDHDKFFLLLFGILIITIKFGNVFMDFIASKSKKEVELATAEDSVLKTQENAANAQANDLVKQAQQLGQEKPVTNEDWYEKK